MLIICLMMILEAGFQLVKDQEVEEYLDQVSRRFEGGADLRARRFEVT